MVISPSVVCVVAPEADVTHRASWTSSVGCSIDSPSRESQDTTAAFHEAATRRSVFQLHTFSAGSAKRRIAEGKD